MGSNGRLQGRLEVSRAFGDRQFKKVTLFYLLVFFCEDLHLLHAMTYNFPNILYYILSPILMQSPWGGLQSSWPHHICLIYTSPFNSRKLHDVFFISAIQVYGYTNLNIHPYLNQYIQIKETFTYYFMNF